MSLETADAKLAAAFDGSLARAVQAFSGSREVVGGSYDPITGTCPTTTTSYVGRGVFSSFKAEELTQHILATDEKLTCLQSELLMLDDGGSVTTDQAEPRVDDLIGGKVVVSVGRDPASITWVLALRKT